MDIAEGSNAPTVAPLLEELEASTRRATALYGLVRLFGGIVDRPPRQGGGSP